VAAADFCGPDSAAGGAQPERGARADGEVWRRVFRLQAKDLVLMRVVRQLVSVLKPIPQGWNVYSTTELTQRHS